jgi:hypothetical protein
MVEGVELTIGADRALQRVPGGDRLAVLGDQVVPADLSERSLEPAEEAGGADMPRSAVAVWHHVQGQGVARAGCRGQGGCHVGRADQVGVVARVQRVSVPVLGQPLAGLERPEGVGLAAGQILEGLLVAVRPQDRGVAGHVLGLGPRHVHRLEQDPE